MKREEEDEQWTLKMVTNTPIDERHVCWLLLQLKQTLQQSYIGEPETTNRRGLPQSYPPRPGHTHDS